MSKVFDDLVKGLNEAIDYECGQCTARTRTFVIEPVKRYESKEIKSIRNQAGMTQAVFADYMGVCAKTVEAWERGTNRPTGSACRLLDILASGKIGDMPFIRTEIKSVMG